MKAPRWIFVAHAWTALYVTLAFPRPLAAHESKTAYLEILETAPGEALATWTLPGPSREATPSFPTCCQVGPVDPEGAARSSRVSIYRLRCQRLRNETVGVEGLGLSVEAAIVRVVLVDGSTYSRVVGREEPRFAIPPASSDEAPSNVFPRFVRLGLAHIATGADHLLFLLGLLWLARGVRRALVTVTAFTAAHSLTLGASVLGWIHVPPAWVEVCIAMSLVWVAMGIRGPGAAKEPARYGAAAIAFGFGLLHGLGFAGGLREIGLPTGAIPSALFGFNVGVELGQLALVALCFVLARSFSRAFPALRLQFHSRAAVTCAYVIGSAGVYLAMSRVASFARAL